MNQTQKDKFRTLLSDFQTAVLITRGKGNAVHARPMAIAGVDENCDLWFITNKESVKVHELGTDAHVCVVCQNGWSSCVTVNGQATLDYDRARLQTLWNASYQVWFPKGVNDPEIVLIHVKGKDAEYWDNSGLNSIAYVYQAIKAIATGTTPEVREGISMGVSS